MYKLQRLMAGLMMGTMLFSAVPAMAASSTPTRLQASDLLDPRVSPESGLGDSDLQVTIARIIRVAMGLLGIVAVVIVLIGGFTWMTAGGNDEKVGEAKKWIFAGVIGLAIILSAYAIANFVIQNLVTATTQ
ncbi:MAG TPA: pilin [Patescibacteria group bacterium]|nr:pilin [Patescibacteria group bacterium]